MAEVYVNLTYREYQAVENALKSLCIPFMETSHISVKGGYHKAIRVPINTEIEFQGPLVKGPLGDEP